MSNHNEEFSTREIIIAAVIGLLVAIFIFGMNGYYANAAPLIQQVYSISPQRGSDWTANTPNQYYGSQYTVAVASDYLGNVYWGGYYGQIWKWDAAANTVTRIAGTLTADGPNFVQGPDAVSSTLPATVWGMCYNNTANALYISYRSGTNMILRWDAASNSITQFAKGTSFSNLRGVDSWGNTLYVADLGANKLYGINLTSSYVYTIAGTGAAGYVDGIGLTDNVKFYQIKGVSIDMGGNTIYVADQNNLMRAIDLANNSAYTVFTPGYWASGVRVHPNNQYVFFGGDYPLRGTYSYKIGTTPATTATWFGGYGSYGDYIYEAKCVTANSKYRESSVSEAGFCFSPDGAFMYQATNNKIYKVVTATTQVTVLSGLGRFSSEVSALGYDPVNTKRFDRTGLGGAYGYDWYGNTLIVVQTNSQIIRKIYEDGTADIVGGSPDAHAITDGVKNASRVQYAFDGVVDTVNARFYFFDNCTIRMLDLNTNSITTVFGTAGQSNYVEGTGSAGRIRNNAQFIDFYGNTLIFSDRGSHCIRGINMITNTSYLIAGIPNSAGDVTGVGLTYTAKFNNPTGLRFDKFSNGNLIYVMDTSNGKIKCIDQAGNSVTTVLSGLSTSNLQLALRDTSASTDIFYAKPGTGGTHPLDLLYQYNIGGTTTELLGFGKGVSGWSGYTSMDLVGNSFTSSFRMGYYLRYNPTRNSIIFSQDQNTFEGFHEFDLDWGTATPTDIATPTATDTDTATPTATPTITQTATVSPTPTPIPDNDSEGGWVKKLFE